MSGNQHCSTAWNGKTFMIIDTGGFEPVTSERMLIQMREQTNLAIEEADAIIFLLDGREGLTPADIEITQVLRKTKKAVFYTVNKIDNVRQEEMTFDFYRLGVDRIYSISSQHGLGVGDLLDDVVEHLPEIPVEEDKEERIRIAVIGKPNVGKSSLINKILGYERTIVNPTPGTTRDATDTSFDLNERKYLFIDTAGIRKKSKVSLRLEKYSVIEAIKTLSRCDIALMMIDAQEGVTDQDTKIAGLAYERGVACILILNKWDLIEKDNSTIGTHVQHVKDTLKYLDFSPIITISALSGQRVTKVFDLINTVYDQYSQRVSTSLLNTKLEGFTTKLPPPRYRNRPNKINYATQIAVRPPTFVFFVREPKGIHFSYERYLSNRIHEELGFEHTPVRLIFRKKGEDRS